MEKTLQELRHEKSRLRYWFRMNDYIVNKVFLGEWEETDQRFLDYKAERIVKRQELETVTNQIIDLCG